MIKIDVLPPEKMRYKTCGDWLEDGTIQIADAGNPDYNFLVAVHEFVEWYLCKRDGVDVKDVDKWDTDHPDADEPGDLPGAPYRFQHQLASTIERLLATHLRIGWQEYDDVLAEVWERSGPK